ncbi:MAG TPA: GspE/PulE family protein [Candidatus Paceibacterota bacterium]|nr:GspE/PulE family protein [Candidatus Paceibacterota bacterium]
MVQFNEEKQKARLADLKKSEEEKLAEILSGKYGLQYIDLSRITINTDALRLIPEEAARRNKMAVFDVVNKNIRVAIQTPNNPSTTETLNELKEKGYFPIVYMVSTESLEKAWSRYKDLSFALETKAGSLDISNQEIETFLHQVNSMQDIQKLINEALTIKKTYRISRVLVIIMAGALSLKASDVHIEPEEDHTRLRYRLDGVLVDVLNFDNETYNLLLSRIKLLSNLKLNIKENAQDGRFSILVSGDEIEVRTSVLPGNYGESIVLRLLNPKSITVPLEELGIEPRLFKILEAEINKPNGMILTTGPTGSGKTTTLYSFMRRIYNPEIKILTIEDPIEYHLAGIVQTQVEPKKGYTFVSGLRAALRQDPDVIMVGEIRDEETAEIAINSSLTGHLVFSTLHTNDAAGTYPRLIDLGVNPKVLSSAINVSIAQRLVRVLCPVCKKEVAVPASTKTTLEKVIASIYLEEFRVPVKTMYEPVGCSECHHQGFKGRIGIFEAILTDEKIEQVVKENPSEREIRIAARPQGILTMEQDGVLKVLKGVTSLSELGRVVNIEQYLNL